MQVGRKLWLGAWPAHPLQSVFFLRWGTLWTCLTLSPCWTWLQNPPFLCTPGWREVPSTKACHCPLPWAWRMPCPKARVGLWPAESPISSVPVELAVCGIQEAERFIVRDSWDASVEKPGPASGSNRPKTQQLPVKWNKMSSKLGLQNKEFATSLLPGPT